MTPAYSATASAPSPAYLANVGYAAHELFKPLFAVRADAAVERIRGKVEVLRLARECRHSAPSLSQELSAIACRD